MMVIEHWEDWLDEQQSTLNETVARAYRLESGMANDTKRATCINCGDWVNDGRHHECRYISSTEGWSPKMKITVTPCAECAEKDAEIGRIKAIADDLVATCEVCPVLEERNQALENFDKMVETSLNLTNAANRAMDEKDAEIERVQKTAKAWKRVADSLAGRCADRSHERDQARRLAADLLEFVKDENCNTVQSQAKAQAVFREKHPWVVKFYRPTCTDCGNLGKRLCDKCLERRR